MVEWSYPIEFTKMLDDIGFEFFVGCCLGDGTLMHRQNNKTFRTDFCLAHSITQEAYIRWKAERLNEIFNRDTSVRSYIAKAKGKEYPSLMYSITSKELKPIKRRSTGIYLKGWDFKHWLSFGWMMVCLLQEHIQPKQIGA